MLYKFKTDFWLMSGILLAGILLAAWYPLQIAFGIRYQPDISSWFYVLLQGVGGNILVNLVAGYILPLISFVMLILIFNRYLNYLWSVAFAFLSFISFTTTPFRSFLIGVMEGKPWLALGSSYPLDIIQIPMPVFSVFTFLIFFYVSIQPSYLEYKKIIFLTILWSLFIWVDSIDSIFGLMFWLSYSLIRFYKQKEGSRTFLYVLVTEFSIVAVFVLLYIFLHFLFPVLHNESLVSLSLHKKSVDLYYYLVYFCLPLILIICVYYIQRIDIYEIFVKFWHIYVLMFIEILLILVANYAPKSYRLLILQNHIPFFFLHFYYYVPVVYFANRPLIKYYSGIESNRFSYILRKLIYILFNKLSVWYLPIFIFLLCIFGGISAYNNFLYQKKISRDYITSYEIN